MRPASSRKRIREKFNLGVSNYRTSRALVYVIEAAKELNGGAEHVSLRLLNMAIKEIEANPRPQ
jgi:hypothetical protein